MNLHNEDNARVVFHLSDTEPYSLPIFSWPVDVIPRVGEMLQTALGQFRVECVRHVFLEVDHRMVTHVLVRPVDVVFYLDDIRNPRATNPPPLEDFVIARNLEEAGKAVLSKAIFSRWSLDQVLGMDFLKWASKNALHKWPRGRVTVHSANHIGSRSMQDFIAQIEQELGEKDVSSPLEEQRWVPEKATTSGKYQMVCTEMWEQMKEELQENKAARKEQQEQLESIGPLIDDLRQREENSLADRLQFGMPGLDRWDGRRCRICNHITGNDSAHRCWDTKR